MAGTMLLVMSFGALACVTVFVFIAVLSWSDSRRKEREALYRSETLRKLAEAGGAGADRVLDIMREEEAAAERNSREGLKLGGIITLAAGIGIALFLAVLDPEEEIGLGPGVHPWAHRRRHAHLRLSDGSEARVAGVNEGPEPGIAAASDGGGGSGRAVARTVIRAGRGDPNASRSPRQRQRHRRDGRSMPYPPSPIPGGPR